MAEYKERRNITLTESLYNAVKLESEARLRSFEAQVREDVMAHYAREDDGTWRRLTDPLASELLILRLKYAEVIAENNQLRAELGKPSVETFVYFILIVRPVLPVVLQGVFEVGR